MNPIITGMVIAVYDSSQCGIISPDRVCKLDDEANAIFWYEDVVDGRQLRAQDRVEFEVEKIATGWAASWVKYTGHGPLASKPEELVEGSGVVRHIIPDPASFVGYIRPDVQGAPDVMFRKSHAYEGCGIGDRVSFIARESKPGKWRAKSVRKMNSPQPAPPPVRDWKDSWKEDAC